MVRRATRVLSCCCCRCAAGCRGGGARRLTMRVLARPQVRALFAVAACLQPSVIFIDEIDSILSARKSDGAPGVLKCRAARGRLCVRTCAEAQLRRPRGSRRRRARGEPPAQDRDAHPDGGLLHHGRPARAAHRRHQPPRGAARAARRPRTTGDEQSQSRRRRPSNPRRSWTRRRAAACPSSSTSRCPATRRACKWCCATSGRQVRLTRPARLSVSSFPFRTHTKLCAASMPMRARDQAGCAPS